MEGIIIKGDFLEYSRNNKIIIGLKEIDSKESFAKVNYQLNTLIDVHKRIEGYSSNINPRLIGNIGKRLQGIKNLISKLQLYLNNAKKIDIKNEFDNFILENGSGILMNITNQINEIYNNNYIDIVKRSIISREICIGKCDSSNLSRKNEYIYINDIRNMKYDLLEEDFIWLINRAFKRTKINNVDILINKYIKELNLGDDSYKYIVNNIYLDITPLKIWNNYINDKGRYNEIESVNLIREYLGGNHE